MRTQNTIVVDDLMLNKLEKLAMIKIADDKRESFKQELGEIIAKIDSLQEVDTDSIELLSNQSTPMREDVVQNANIREEVLAHAPKAQDGYFIVPKVIG